MARLSLKHIYLAGYNINLFIGWCHILYLTIQALKESGPFAVYDAVEKPLQLWQTLALVEVFNSLTGIVRSPITATLPQVASRLFIVWGILFPVVAVRDHFLVASLVLSWSITEMCRLRMRACKHAVLSPPNTCASVDPACLDVGVRKQVVRYLFFALKEATGITPAPLLWLRYSLFFVLYPTGILSEAGLTYFALPYLKMKKSWDIEMPNAFNFAFSYYVTVFVVLLAYIPGGPFMYTYMMAQRKKALGGQKKEKGA